MRALAAALLLTLPALADVVVLVDGKVLEGRVTEEGQGVRILLANGGSTFVPRDRVARIERKASDVEVFQERRKALAPDDLKGRLELAVWAKARGMDRAVGNLAREALALDPGNAQARALLGQVSVGGEWVTEEEALRRGFARLAEGWGEWDEKYAEEERALHLPPGVLEKARKALGDPEAMAALDLSSRAWTCLLHRRGSGEPPCLLVLDASEGRTLAAEAGKAAPGAEVVAEADPKALLAALEARRVDRTRVVLVSAEEGAWTLLASRPELFSSAVLGGAPRDGDLAFLANAQGLDLYTFPDPADVPDVRRRREGASDLLRKLKGRALERPRAELARSLEEALARRRNPRPEAVRRRVQAPGTFAWVRVEALSPQGPPPGDFPWLEARVTPRNSIFLATRHLKSLTLLLSDDLVDLSQPVTVTLNGKQAFQGPLKPDLGALAAAAQEGDRHGPVSAVLALDAGP